MTRRQALAAIAPVVVAGGAVGATRALGQSIPESSAASGVSLGGMPGDNGSGATMGSGFTGFRRGSRVDYGANGFDPRELVRDFDYGVTSRLASGRVLREWTLVAEDKELEVAPGVTFAAWTYNGRIPGPTLRAVEGELLRVHFVNGASHPHTVHFHGIHAGVMDGVPGVGPGLIERGQRFTYEFGAEPAPSLGLYNCHASPLAQHIAKGLYGLYIVDPKEGREPADELAMMMMGFDTNFDGANEMYAVNGIPFAYAEDPIKVKRGELVRIYLANMTEFDLVNSMHIHGVYFDYFPSGTSLRPAEFTDTIVQSQGQRGILEVRFETPGMHMFHAHSSEFTELGWMGFFEVGE